MLSTYQHGHSWIHRIYPSVKLLFLLACGMGLFFYPNLWLSATVLCLVLGLYRLALIPYRVFVDQLRALFWIVLILFVVQWWLNDLSEAMLVCSRLVGLVSLASLVTLTTRMTEMVASIERLLYPFRFLGVNPEKLSLSIALVLRFIPLLNTVFNEVREAQRVRGLERNWVAMAVPVLIRTLRMADHIAQAMDARAYESATEIIKDSKNS